MRITQSLIIPAVLALLGSSPVMTVAAGQDGVAVAVIFDTSGSMQDAVRDGSGGLSPKYRIASRALESVANQLQAYATNTAGGKPHTLHAGLFTFTRSGAREVVKLGPLNAQALRDWARNFSNPSGGTPLGSAVEMAAQAVMRSKLMRKHVLVITDGINTVGRDPATVMPRLKKQAEQAHTGVSFHFVAFDVNAEIFAPLKKLGATVVSAADEKQLNTQLGFILQQKILLEDEEPVKK